MRLDKLLAHMGYGSRKDVKSLLKKKCVTVDNKIVKDGRTKIDTDTQVVKVKDKIVEYQKYMYLLMNKTSGYLSATEDRYEKTVLDLVPAKYQHFKLFPVGRLDKDTEGLLLLTNDGKVNHLLTSPKKDIEKTYYAKISGTVTQEDITKFAKGVKLNDGYVTKSAKLKILQSSDQHSEIELTITEGKFHQVKRMFLAVGKKVTYLKRIKMGKLTLDKNLRLGEVRELNEAEMAYIHTLKQC